MDNVYTAWIIAMISFVAIIEVFDVAQCDRKKHKLHISKHSGRPFR